MNLKTSECLEASTFVKNFVDKEGTLPNYVMIWGEEYSMEEYMYISSNMIAAESKSALKDFTPALKRVEDGKHVLVDKPVITPINANIDKNTFYDMNQRVANYFVNNNKAPSYVSSKYGNVQFQAHIYANSKILDFYKKNKVMPNYVSLNLTKNSELLNYMPEYLDGNIEGVYFNTPKGFTLIEEYYGNQISFQKKEIFNIIKSYTDSSAKEHVKYWEKEFGYNFKEMKIGSKIFYKRAMWSAGMNNSGDMNDFNGIPESTPRSSIIFYTEYIFDFKGSVFEIDIGDDIPNHESLLKEILGI